MIVPREELGPIAGGETDEVHVDQYPPPVGTVEPVHAETGEAACSVEILDWWHHVKGGWMVRFSVVAVVREPIRLLSKSAITTQPYTSSTENAAPGEPEAIDAGTLDRYARENEHATISHLHQREAERRERWTLDQRMKRALHLAYTNGVDVNSELRVLERKVELLERKVGARVA